MGGVWPQLLIQLGQQLLEEGREGFNQDELFTRLRFVFQQQPHLIILDGLEDFSDWTPFLTQLVNFLDKGKCLLTSPRQPPAEIEAAIIPVPELTFEAAKDLLNFQAEITGGFTFENAAHEDIQNLYEIVGGHPLALRLIPRLARMYSLPDILSAWQTIQPGQIAEMVQSIYNGIWQTLAPSEIKLLQVMPFIASTGATIEYLQAISGLSSSQLWTSLTNLMDCCLIEPQGNLYQRRYGTHRLTVQYIMDQMQNEPDFFPSESVVTNALGYWQVYLNELTGKEWQKLDAEQDNLARALQYSLSLADEKITEVVKTAWQDLFISLARFVDRRGYVTKWLPIFEQMATKFSGTPATYCRLLNKLGELYRANHQLQQAIALHAQVLRLAEQANESLEVAQAFLNLGNDYLLDRQYKAAAGQGMLALAAYETLALFGKERAATLNLLGTSARRQGHLEEGSRYLRESCDIWRDLKLWPELARTLHNLSLVLQAQGNVVEAEQCLQEAKGVLADTASELDLALICIAEGAFYFDQKLYDKAEKAMKGIDLSYLAQSGYKYYQAYALNNLGNVAFVRGSFIVAGELLEESVDLWQQLAEPIEMANSLGKLGDVLVAQRRQAEGRLKYQQAIDLLSRYDKEGLRLDLKQALIHDLDGLGGANKEG